MYRPSGDRDDRIALSLPRDVMRAIEMVAAQAGRHATPPKVAIVALDHGLGRLDALPAVRTLRRGREIIMCSDDSPAIDQVHRWDYTVAGRSGKREMLTPRNIDPRIRDRAIGLTSALGIAPMTTVTTIAIIAGLVDEPLAADLASALADELRAFLRVLGGRAALAEQLAGRVVPASRPARHVTWAELLQEAKRP